MDNTLMTILGIFIAAILIFVFPLMSLTERNDDIAQSVVQTATTEFVDKISLSGLIKPADYEEYIQKLESTGNTFDVQMEVQHLDENFGKKNGTTSQDLIGENERYSTFTTEILENMYLSDGSAQNYMLKKGDNVIVTAKNTNKTMAETLRTFVNKASGKGTYEVAAISSSMVVNNGGKVQLGNEGEPDEPTNTPTEYTTYSVGDIVTIGTESFYVIEASDSSNPNLKLLAKDCIDVANLVQSASANTVQFSTEVYWDGEKEDLDIIEPEPTLDAVTGKLTLPASHIAAKAAYDYGAKVGGTGRVPTLTDMSLIPSYIKDSTLEEREASIGYWISGSQVGYGTVTCIYMEYFNEVDNKWISNYWVREISDLCYLRPIVEISKSAL